jgi:hypothetical protein
MEKDNSVKNPEWHKKPENKAKIREQQKKWRENNKDKIKIQRKNYYENNKEKIIGYNKGWREKHPDKMKKYNEKAKERYKNDPEFRAKMKDSYKKWLGKKKGEKICMEKSKDSNVVTATPQLK